MSAATHQGPLYAVLRTVTDREWKADILVFVSYFATAKLAQFILFTLETSPALLWAPTGIALAAVILKGNKMWVPIALAYLAAILTLPGYLPLENKLFAAVGFTIQPLIGAWIFRYMGSNGTVHKSKDVMILMGGAVLTAAIGPLFNTIGQVMLGALAETIFLTFSRAWAGGLLGIVIMTPLITSWYHSPHWPIERSKRAEAVSAFGFLTLAIYSLFWISVPSLVFLLIFFLCAVLFWISSRFGSRVNTSALLYVTVLGVLGSIIAQPTDTPLNAQLFADELFMLLIAPIFLQFFVLAEERRQAELSLKAKVTELERLTNQLAQNDDAKNEFIAILAHELRNPLSTMVSTLEVMKLEALSQESQHMLMRAEEQTVGMRRLLDDLLDVARMTEKKFNIIPEQIELKTIVDRSIHTTEYLRDSKHQSVRVWMPEQTVLLHADPVRMEQVLVNLLNNASKYSADGDSVEIMCTADDASVLIAVKDTGDGIPPELLEKIFEPFQQIGPSPHRASGIGIGLFLTRQIVSMHGGTITAHSMGRGTGSTFTVLLPVRKVKAAVATASASVTPQIVTAVQKRILVVDDNAGAATGMSRLLEHHGHTVQTAANGREALDAFHAFAPEVVLLDIGLPDMSGHIVAGKIRAHAGVQPVLIALTGYGQASDKEEAAASGFSYHLTKPVSVSDVIKILNSLS